MVRREQDHQKCAKGHRMTRLPAVQKAWGSGYPKKIWTMKGEPVATSPMHYQRLLKERGLVVAGGAKRGWT